MSSAELRNLFLEFFRERDHTIVSTSSLVPGNDPTLLFTNAGMVQFKDTFLGREQRNYTRAASSQRCVRAGGKHNDLENVGYTARHHTFFEMLGNFSFGDYFKRDAIHYAWTFLTEVIGLPAERLWVTVFEQDSESEEIWLREIGVDSERFRRIGESDNFWSMGDIGPCGPCTEIFYDHGEAIAGGPPGSADAEGDRFVEIWNLVFMQYDRDRDGQLVALPKPSVDTGMGLERLAAVVQGVANNYQTDLFTGLIDVVAQMADCEDKSHSSLCVIADHIRSSAFLITDGVLPSNEGRGYVLRRIIRRAIRHGYRLGIDEYFFYRLVAPLCETLGEAFPELNQARDQVEQVLKNEEMRFSETLRQGMKILEASVTDLSGKMIPGDIAFQLYDTYGFPFDLTADYARENGLQVDQQGFNDAMALQRERARGAGQFATDYQSELNIPVETEFTGYRNLRDSANIISLIKDNASVERLVGGDAGVVVLNRTPFYAESGGQVGDRGKILTHGGEFSVQDTQKYGAGYVMHRGEVTGGELAVGATCDTQVDSLNRQATALNHSATHLLHAALRRILGGHVGQKGSLVDAERLRFDFSHFEALPADVLVEVESLVNQEIRGNRQVSAETMSKDAALNAGAMALFGEKYGDEVRVLRIGDFSTELCGGTHVQQSGDIGFFKIISETGIAAGVRRIEAVTGTKALEWVQQRSLRLQNLAAMVNCSPDVLTQKVQQVLDKNRHLEKELKRVKAKLASQSGGDLSAAAIDVGGVKVVAAKLADVDAKSLRETIDQLKTRLGSAAIVLATIKDGKVILAAGVTKDQTAMIKAGELVNSVAAQVGGKGGGRPDFAQAGGDNPAALDAALAGIPELIRQRIG